MSERRRIRRVTQEQVDEYRRLQAIQRRLFPGDGRLLAHNPEVDRLTVPIGEMVRLTA